MRQEGICNGRATYFSGEDVSKKSSKSDLARIDRMKASICPSCENIIRLAGTASSSAASSDKDIDFADIPPLDRSFFTKPLAAWPRKKSARPRGTRRKR